jgi:tetratricopeptide (TPR) repeat protein
MIAGDVFFSRSPGAGEGTGTESDARRDACTDEVLRTKRQAPIADSRISRRLKAISLLQQADRLHQAGLTVEGVHKMIEAVAQSPDDIEIYHRLARMLIDSERFQDALDALASAPAAPQANPRQVELAGICHSGLDRLDEADRCADQALAIHPGSAAALDLKGMVALGRGEHAGAVDFCSRAVAADPGYGPAHTHRGVVKWNAGAADAALEDLARGFVMAPTDSTVIKTYHAAVVSSGNLDLAERLFRDAQGHYPSNRRIAFLLIDILIRREDHRGAMDQIERAMARFGADEGMLSAALSVRQKVGPPGGASRPPRLSLCMIVKNEQAHLARCLESVKAVVDEIVVVDTGSTDLTGDIARTFGAKVVEHPWAGDFSEARNVSLRHATGDWVIVLDADEVVAPGDHARLRALVRARHSRSIAYALTTRNYTDQSGSRGWTPNTGEYRQEECGKGWFPSTKVRLFRNDPRIRFDNAVHETVEGALRSCGIPVHACPVPVHHYGRMDPAAVAAKGKTYFALGKKKLEATGGDIDALRELAIQAGEIGEYDEAVRIWEAVLDRAPSDARAWMNMGYVRLAQQKFEEARTASRMALDLNPALKEAAVNWAHCELVIGSASQAASFVERVLNEHPEYPPAMGVAAVACCLDGREAQGLEMLHRLGRMRYDCAQVLREQASALASQGRIEGARVLRDVAAKVKGAHTDGHACMVAH